jgi:hypothetical protein
MNVEIGTEATQFLLGIHKFNIHYSVGWGNSLLCSRHILFGVLLKLAIP